MKTIDIKLNEAEYRLLVNGLNDAADLCQISGEKIPDVVYSLLKQLLVAGLKVGWSKLPSCFSGDEDIAAAAGEREFPDPNTKH